MMRLSGTACAISARCMSESENLLSLLSSSSFPGIGRKTAKRLIDRFGGDLYEILRSGNRRRLAGSLTPRKIQALLDGWECVSAQEQVVRWLDHHGVDPAMGRQIVRVWGKDSLEKLSENPFRLLAMADWKVVDGLAARLGVPNDDPARLVGAAEAAAYRQINEHGSTWISADKLLVGVADFLSRGINSSEANNLASQAISLGKDTKALLRVDSGYQVPGAYFAEREIEGWVAQRLNNAQPDAEPKREKGWGQDYGLTIEQERVVCNALRHPLSIFYGPGGTGKTFTVRAICDFAERAGMRITLLALAAKAARKLEAAAGRPSMTIARALHRLRMSDFQDAMAIVDEFSMVDLLDFRQLIRRLPSSAHLVLCGDSAQLPSIGPGRLLHSFIQSGAIPSQELTFIHRQSSGSGIPVKLRAIRSGLLPDLPAFDWMSTDKQGLYFLPCTPGNVARLVLRLFNAYLTAPQIISPLQKGPFGALSLNRFVHLQLRGDAKLAPGTPVVFTSNITLTSGDEVVNGLQGRIHSVLRQDAIHPDTPHVIVDTEQGLIICTQTETESILELSYVLTVHRAQGSDWDTVIAVLPPCRLLERSMVYTALSRCKQRCVVLAPDVEALRGAVAARPAHELREDRLFLTRKVAQ